MTTLAIRSMNLVFVSLTGLLPVALTACGSDASNTTRARDRTSILEPRDPATLAGAGASERARHDPNFIARVSSRAPQDPPPPRPSTKEQCDACAGLWGVFGIEEIESCICKTSDEGRDCSDGNDCQGECLLHDDAEFHVMDQGNPPRGYYLGQCARYDVTFGCFRHVPSGITTELPLTPEEAGPYICVD